MTTLTEFWPTVPSLSYAELRVSGVIFPNAEAASYLTGQDVECDTTRSRTSIRPMSDGRYLMNCDLLREFHPDSNTGLYDPKFADVITQIGDQTLIEDWAASVEKLQAGAPEDEGTEVQLWVQPVPGDSSQWFNMGFPFGHRVRWTIDGTEYTMKSTIDFNVWEPVFDARYWEPDPAQAIPWKNGQVWNVGDVVHHFVDDPTYPPAVNHWRSKIDANTTEPGHDAGFYRYWEIADEDYDPTAPKPYVVGRAYGRGEQMTNNGKTWQSTYSGANVWDEVGYPSGWEEVVTAQGKSKRK